MLFFTVSPTTVFSKLTSLTSTSIWKKKEKKNTKYDSLKGMYDNYRRLSHEGLYYSYQINLIEFRVGEVLL